MDGRREELAAGDLAEGDLAEGDLAEGGGAAGGWLREKDREEKAGGLAGRRREEGGCGRGTGVQGASGTTITTV